MTIESFATKAVKYGREVLMEKFSEPKNRHKLGMKLYFAKKVIMAKLADPALVGTILDKKTGEVLVDELEAATMEGFNYTETCPFEGLCDMRKEDAQEFFDYIKAV